MPCEKTIVMILSKKPAQRRRAGQARQGLTDVRPATLKQNEGSKAVNHEVLRDERKSGRSRLLLHLKFIVLTKDARPKRRWTHKNRTDCERFHALAARSVPVPWVPDMQALRAITVECFAYEYWTTTRAGKAFHTC